MNIKKMLNYSGLWAASFLSIKWLQNVIGAVKAGMNLSITLPVDFGTLNYYAFVSLISGFCFSTVCLLAFKFYRPRQTPNKQSHLRSYWVMVTGVTVVAEFLGLEAIMPHALFAAGPVTVDGFIVGSFPFIFATLIANLLFISHNSAY